MKVIIAGSRNFTDLAKFEANVEHYFATVLLDEEVEIVSGGAKGVDQMAEYFASEHCLPFTEFSADWDKHGKSAGPIRNQQMAEYADILIAFLPKDGKSKGTRDMINKAISHGLEIHIFRF